MRKKYYRIPADDCGCAARRDLANDHKESCSTLEIGAKKEDDNDEWSGAVGLDEANTRYSEVDTLDEVVVVIDDDAVAVAVAAVDGDSWYSIIFSLIIIRLA